MTTNTLSEHFFDQNPLDKISAAQLLYFQMITLLDSNVDDVIYKSSVSSINSERLTAIEEEKEHIASLNNAEDIISILRKKHDPLNNTLLCRKAIDMQQTVMPLLLKRYKTSLQDQFIEASGCIMAHCDMQYLEQLKELYPIIRSPYAQSVACLVFAVQKQTELIPLILSEYERLKRNYPKESYAQGPLLALYMLYDEL